MDGCDILDFNVADDMVSIFGTVDCQVLLEQDRELVEGNGI